jgi:hypothetical protein
MMIVSALRASLTIFAWLTRTLMPSANAGAARTDAAAASARPEMKRMDVVDRATFRLSC